MNSFHHLQILFPHDPEHSCHLPSSRCCPQSSRTALFSWHFVPFWKAQPVNCVAKFDLIFYFCLKKKIILTCSPYFWLTVHKDQLPPCLCVLSPPYHLSAPTLTPLRISCFLFPLRSALVTLQSRVSSFWNMVPCNISSRTSCANSMQICFTSDSDSVGLAWGQIPASLTSFQVMPMLLVRGPHLE